MAQKKKKQTYAEFMQEKYGATNDYYDNVQSKLREKQEREEAEKKKKNEQTLRELFDRDEDIAPVATTKKKDTWFDRGAFDDGYQFGDVTKTILGTVGDIGENLIKGIGEMPEKLLDAGMTLGTKMNQSSMQQAAENEMVFNALVGNKEKVDNTLKRYATYQKDVEKETAEFVAKDIIKTDKINFGVDDLSVLGEKSDALVQSAGQLGATAALQAVGVPWWLTTGATSFGAEAENAFNQGATFDEAILSSAISAGAEVLTEKLSGGIKFGGKTLDEGLTKALASRISNKFARTALKLGLDATGEGAEEWITEDIGRFGQWLTYQDEKTLKEMLYSEEAMDEKIQAFIGGAALGGVISTGNAIKSASKGVDYVTGLTKNEQTVVDKEVVKRIAEQEENGKQLTNKEKDKIYDDVLSDLDKGYISTDTIEETLGGDTYKSYKDTTESEDALKKELDELRQMKSGDRNDIQNDRLAELKAMNLNDTTKSDELKKQLGEEVFGLVKDSRLVESYNERGRRSQAYQADTSKYDAKQQAVIQNAIDSGILNNTNRTHEFVDMIAKISADKGVSFDFTNNERLKESGFAIDGKTINGYVTKDGVTLNIQSAKALNSVVGHETTHVLEGTELYNELQKSVIEYAKSKGDYQGRYDALTKLYAGVENADIDAELTADLVGDYLFTDSDFINNLSTKHRNVFQKIYDEIKYLCKVATAGSKEARELERVKRAFADAYRQNGKAEGDSTERKYSLGYHAGDLGKSESLGMQSGGRDTGHYGTGTYFVGNEAEISDGHYGKRPHEKVDFDKYNLFQPKTEANAGKLHDFLKGVNYYYNRDANMVTTDEEIDAIKEQVDELTYDELTSETLEKVINLVSKVAGKYKTNDALWSFLGDVSQGGDGTFYNGDKTMSMSEVAEAIRDKDSAAYKLQRLLDDGYVLRPIWRYQEWNESVADAAAMFGVSEESVREIISDIRAEIEAAEYDHKTAYTADSASTRFMKALGYEGVDVRGIKQYDNTMYGSVIYDLKGEDLARKQAIGTAKYSLSDSDGKQLTNEQNEFFKDSKVRDENGNLKVMHHGSPETFTVFDKSKAKASGYYGRGFYFTDSDSHAKQYGNTYDVYLNITNPIQDGTNNITKEQLRKFVEAVAENEDYGIDNYGYGATVDSVTDSVYGKSDFAMLMDVNASCVGDMVAAIELFNEVNGTDYNGIITPTETVAFYPEQIKRTDNKKPTGDPDIRFSLSEAVEETNDLMALHNLTEGKLLKSLKLGGLPMPSVAIARAKDGHGEFGDITLVLNKDAIDPNTNSRNKLYSGDAWTPTYPAVEYKPNRDVLFGIEDKISTLVPYEVRRELGSLMFDTDNARDSLNRYNGNMVEAYKQNDSMKYAYLKDTGSDITLPMKQADLYLYGDHSNAAVRYFSGKLVNGLQTVELYRNMNSRDLLEDKALAQAVADAQNFDVLRTLEPGSAEYAEYEQNPDFSADEVSLQDILHFLDAAKTLFTKGVEQKVDRVAAKELIRESVDQTAYENWLEELFDGVVEKEGIRNNKDFYTPSGNRRSFEALHYEHNLENVIKAMREKGEKGIGNGFGGASIFGAATTEFSSIEDMKQSSDRLQKMSYDEYQELRKGFTDRFLDIAFRLPNVKNSFTATDSAAEVLTEAVAKYKTRSGIANYLKRELQGWATYSDEVVDDLIELVSDIRKMPTGYFEAKPQRAVGFDEVGVFVIPRNADVKLKQELLSRGYAIAEYDPDVEGDRQKVVNSFEEYKFSLSDAAKTPKKYGNYNVYGKDVMLEQDVAPVSENVSKVGSGKEYIGMDDFLNRDSSVWRNVDYNDDATKASIMKNTHEDMVKDGAIVVVADDVINSVKQSYPDLRGVKKNERTLRLREAMKTLKSNIRQFLGGLKDQSFDFEVNGKVLEAKLYNTGINEVLEKVTQEKANMLYTSEEIFKNARYLYSTPDYGGDPNVYRWNYFYTPVQIGQETVGVRIAIRDTATPRESQIYNWGIKKDASLDGVGRGINNRISHDVSSDASANSITDFSPFVKPDEDTVSDNFAPTAEDIAEFFPSDPTLDDLKREAEGLIAEAVKHPDDADTVNRLYEQYTELQKKIEREEAEEAAWNKEQLASLDDADAPPEVEAPYYSLGEDVKPDNPFENRDIKAVGNRKVKAYMYENPEVKPYFQEAANVLLGELNRTQRGERLYTPIEGGVPGAYGSDSYGVWTGVPRHTSPDIAYLLDELHYTYDDIENGIKAIIEDNGKENNACSKRIEFLLNDRLLKGYPDMDYPDNEDMYTPPNQEYINLLNEKQITEYNEESFKRFMESAEEYAPPADDFAPVAETVAPVKEAYEAIRPPKESKPSAEPRMKRADSKNNAKDGEKERSWYETSTGSEAVDGIITPDDIPDDVRYYQVKSNKKSLATANARLAKDGYAKSREYFEGRMTARQLSVEDIALGERLIQEAAKAGDAKAVRDLIIDVSILGTELGQRVQALSMIRRLTPEGQLKALIRTVGRGKAKGDKAFNGVEVTEDMTKRITDTIKKDGTFDQAELDRAVEDVKQQIADQMPVGALDYINAWRYLSMLGNPKTHIRNVVSNVAMLGTRTVKNAVARTIETIAPIENRTKTWRPATAAVKDFAKQTTADMEAAIKGDNKYSDESSIKAKRKIFKTVVGNALSDFNTNSMEAEDAVFSKQAFRATLQEYLTANGIKTAADIQNNSSLVEKAKDYALDEARRATFRQDSFLASKISEIEKKNPLYGIAVGSIMPFKKTPINIAKTGAAYSPLGFARNVYDVVKVAKGEMDASEAIDHLAQTLTGTALTLIGYALAESGILNGAGDDDKEGKYDYQLGKQSYSFNYGGDTYSLNWLSPVAMPLFVGANAYETLVEKNEWDANVVIDTLGQTLDPLSEMSFLSSLDDVLSSYDSGIAKIWGAGESMAQNYVTQFVPTVLSQIATAKDDVKRSTKVSGDSGFEFGEETLNKIKYKIPGLRETLEPTTDIWGNEYKQTEDGSTRAFESFLSPANKRENITTAVDAELKAIYREVGESEILPAIPHDYINYKGVKYDMSATDYTEYKQTYGQTAYNLMESLFATDTYKNASTEEKADMIADVYDHARDVANKEYFTKFGVDYTTKYLITSAAGDANYATDGTLHYRRDEDGKWTKISDKQLERQNEVTEALGITPEEYWSKTDVSFIPMTNGEYEYGFDYPGKYAISKAVGGYDNYKSYVDEINNIGANNDSSSGVKDKDLIKDYIFGLDLDYGEKAILYRSKYSSKADKNEYNADIVDYLNSRDDISYEEMVTILEELDMYIGSDGYVYWD